MKSLMLNSDEFSVLNLTLEKMEAKNGNEYSYTPEKSTFSCKCSGPAQSCVWH